MFLLCFALLHTEEVRLKAPDLSRENIIGTNVGIRPFRKSGVRIEAEILLNKWIIHNYGYGGSGITLCFGGSKEVIDLLRGKNCASKQVAVLGAGVIGLATAYDLIENGYTVHIYADEWMPNITSSIAPGIWTPLVLSSKASKEQRDLNERMLKASHERLLKSLENPPEFAGVRLVPHYSFRKGLPSEILQAKHQGEDVTVIFDHGITKQGNRSYELGFNGKVFLEDLSAKVQAKGATLTKRHFSTSEDLLTLAEPIIVNCTSIGSRSLFNDSEFIPIRGHIVYFKPQEGFDYLIFENVLDMPGYWVSIYSWHDRIIVNGVYERWIEEPIINVEIIETLIKNAQKCLSNTLN